MQKRNQMIFPATIAFSIGLMVLGLFLQDPAEIPMGLYHIVTMQDLLTFTLQAPVPLWSTRDW